MVSPLLLVTSVTLTFFLAALLVPLLVQSYVRTGREPTGDERDRFASLAPEFGIPKKRLKIVETAREDAVEITVKGPPSYRVSFVSGYVLSGLEEDIARALLTAEAARQTVRYTEYRIVAATIAVFLGTASTAGIVPFSTGFFILLVVAVILFAGGRWLQYRADSIAADEVGGPALADAFEVMATRRGGEPETGGFGTYFSIQPTLGDRIERLRGRT